MRQVDFRRVMLLTGLIAVAVLGTVPAGADTGFTALSLKLHGLESLGTDYVYEGWLVVDGSPVSTGTFSVDAAGNPMPQSFLVDALDADAATAFVVTIEPEDDMDPLPAHTHVLAGDLVMGMADLTVGHSAALGDDFALATGGYILETPSTGSTPGDYDQGIWFLDPMAGPGASLDLPTLPDGWMYEGWVVGMGGPVTTGRFLDTAMADSDMGGPTAGPDGTPPFPGQDFITPPMVLTGYAAVISVEPEPDDSDHPFAIKPLIDMMVADVGAGVLQPMDNMYMSLPRGTLEVTELVALDLEFTGVESLTLPYVYEGWLIVDGNPVSTGAFVVNNMGVPSPSRFLVKADDADMATAFVVTIESILDGDPAPSDTHFLGGDIMTGMADLDVAHGAALGDDFTMAAGAFILETPSTSGIPGDYNQGIWFLDPMAGPGASLDLPTLPAGWIYEGWVADSMGPVSTGKFLDPSMADMDGAGPDAGPDATPPFPGQDFITPPRDLTTHHAAVISVEPYPDDNSAPFSIKPLVDSLIQDSGAGTLQDMQNKADELPTGMISFHDLVPMALDLDGVESLGTDYVYEGWLVGDRDPVSTGRFRVDSLGRSQPSRFLVDMDAADNADAFVLTVEPADDPDPGPAHTHYLAGDVNDGSALLTISHPAALGDSFSMASGGYILETPSTSSTVFDYDQGIWFLDPMAGPGASLDLPTLPAGWIYEGWVVGNHGPVTTGRFLDPAMADSDMGGSGAGPDGTPPFPGQDFINPAMVLTGHTAVISIEPEPDNSTKPFTLKPLMDMDIEDVGAGTLQTMANRAAMNPTGRVDLRLPRAYGVRIDMPTMAHAGEPFWVVGLLDNPDTPRMDVPTFFVLGVQGEYWFWPSWGQYDPMVPGSVDYMMMDVPTGTTSEWVINLFTWPDIGSETVTGLQMIGAFLNSSMTDIEGDWALAEWGYGP